MAAYEETVVDRFRQGMSFEQIARDDDASPLVIQSIVRTAMIYFELGASARWSQTAEGLAEHDEL